jgi:hypothetical protein
MLPAATIAHWTGIAAVGAAPQMESMSMLTCGFTPALCGARGQDVLVVFSCGQLPSTLGNR